MNLTAFLKAVDSRTAQMNLEECTAFIHEISRSYPESQRIVFLDKLEEYASGKDNVNSRKSCEDSHLMELKAAAVKEQLDPIESGELMLSEEYNEEYDDWYNSSAEEILYSDPEHIMSVIEDAVKLAHACYDRELFGLSSELYERLRTLAIQTDGEYSGEPVSLDEAVRMNLLQIDYDAFLKEALVSVYLHNSSGERAEKIFEMIAGAAGSAITLESFLQSSETELPDVQEFLRDMTVFLGKRRGYKERHLLEEAVSLEDSWERFHEAAATYASDHPGLYKKAVFENPGNLDKEQLLQLGKEAVENIPIKYVIRSEIALRTAELALELGLVLEAEKYRLEAFRSDVSPINYLRAYLEAGDYTKMREDLRGIYDSYIDDAYSVFKEGYDYSGYRHPENEVAETSPGRNTLLSLMFFDGRYEEVLRFGMSTKKTVGWSDTFMKRGMALFLLYLYQRDSLLSGCREMCRRVCEEIAFDTENYCKGLAGTDVNDIPKETVFMKLFRKWQERITMSEETRKVVLRDIEGWIRKRVKGIMEGNHRKYYGECASYIAAYGEVLESRGISGAKEKIMEDYRSEYSRRRAFHEELRRYGMADKRKR